MAECVVNLQCAPRWGMNQPCVSGSLGNAPRVLVYNPLGCNRWNTRLLSAKISVRPLDLSTTPRPGARRCVTANLSPQEPMQQQSVETLETEEPQDDSGRAVQAAGPGNVKSVWASAIDFAASLVSALTTDPSQTKKKRNRTGERKVYLLAAIASSIGFITLAAGAVYYRFYWQMQVRIPGS